MRTVSAGAMHIMETVDEGCGKRHNFDSHASSSDGMVGGTKARYQTELIGEK